MIKPSTGSVLLALIACQIAAAQVPTIVRDINPLEAGSSPMFLQVFDGRLYFRATTDDAGAELWLSDGTEAGTVLAEDLSTAFAGSAPSDLVVWNGELYFTAFTSYEIWKTTGGVGNAVRIASGLRGLGFTPFSSSMLPTDVLVFAGQSESTGATGLWRTDGTGPGTVAFGTFNSDSSGPSPRGFSDLSGTLVFFASEIGMGREPYASDGTTAGTGLIREINAGPIGGISDVSGSAAVTLNNQVYFPGFASGSGRKLWRSNGTDQGTRLLFDTDEPVYDDPEYLTVMGDAVYFLAETDTPPRQLWRLNATADHPTQLTFAPAFRTETCFSFDTVVYQNRLYFPRTDETNGCELWVSDGSETGTALLKNINPGASGSFPSFVGIANEVLYFSALTADEGFELWRTDGTEDGTFLVADLNPGSGIGLPYNAAAVLDGDLYFAADDGTRGVELYALRTMLADVVFDDGFEETAVDPPAP